MTSHSSYDIKTSSPEHSDPARRTAIFADDSEDLPSEASNSTTLPSDHREEGTVPSGSGREERTSSGRARPSPLLLKNVNKLTGSGGSGPGAMNFGSPRKVPGLEGPGRSKSLNIGALLAQSEQQDTAEEAAMAQSGSYASKFGAHPKKGFYATKQPTSPSSSTVGSPSRSGVDRKGFYANRTIPATTLAEQQRGGLRDEGERSGDRLDRASPFSGSSGRIPGSSGGESSRGGASSTGTPSPRGSSDHPIFLPQAAAAGSVNTHAPKNAKKEQPGAQFPKPFMGGLFWQPTKAPLLPSLSVAGMKGGRGEEREQDRFELLLLGEEEYYFKDYACHFHPQGGKQQLAGTLKVCSVSLFFVPENIHEPVFRVLYSNTESIQRNPRKNVTEEEEEEVEEFFVVKASERTDMRIGNRHVPYRTHKGEFLFHFALLYTSLDAMLPRVNKLLEVAKCPLQEQPARLTAIMKKHEEELKFNAGWFEDAEETVLLESICSMLTPLVHQPGRVVLTAWAVYFQPFNVVSSAPVLKYKLETVTAVMQRSMHGEQIGVELFFSAWKSVYFLFKSVNEMVHFNDLLVKQPGLSVEKMRTLEQWQRDWASRSVSNFEYLMYLNREANRSFNDLSQYPIFPWVLSDYTSEKLDLTNPDSFRDLSKPIGALNPTRLAQMKERYYELADAYENWSKTFSPDPPPPSVPGMPSPPFLYGCHYSTPGYVVFFKLRDRPQLMLRLQNGRYDMPDRLLSSIEELWSSVMTKSGDLKELIPEFYSLDPSFLVNSEGLDFGAKQNGDTVGDVILPPWASSPLDFCHKMREALECPYVSRKLHKWINLIFGCKQRGEGALVAHNVFHPLTYDDLGAEVLQSLEEGEVKSAIRVQMREFGRTPKQLFRVLHPPQQRSEVRRFADFLHKCRRHLRLLPLLSSPARLRTSFIITSIQNLARNSGRLALEMKRMRKPKAGPQRHKLTYRAAIAGALTPLAELARQDRSVYRAIGKLLASDPTMQTFAVEWLEQSAQFMDPDMLEVARSRHLKPLLSYTTSRKDRKRALGLRAVAALTLPWPNRRLVLDAGFLDPICTAIRAPYGEATRGAVVALSRLTTDSMAVEGVSKETVEALLGLLKRSEGGEGSGWREEETGREGEEGEEGEGGEESMGEAQAAACESLGNLCSWEQHAEVILLGEGVKLLLPLAKAGEEQTAELREMALRALAALAVHPEAQQELVESGGANMVLQVCNEDTGLVQEAAMWVLAALSTNDRLRVAIAAAGGLRLMCNASCAGQADLQEAAAAGLSALCEDPSVIATCIREEGMWPLIAMAQSTHPEVQRVAAGAFWNLAVHDENKRRVLSGGGIQSLLALSLLGDKNRQAMSLAEEALLRLTDDAEIRELLEEDESFVSRTRSIVREVRGEGGGEGAPGKKRLVASPSRTLAHRSEDEATSGRSLQRVSLEDYLPSRNAAMSLADRFPDQAKEKEGKVGGAPERGFGGEGVPVAVGQERVGGGEGGKGVK